MIDVTRFQFSRIIQTSPTDAVVKLSLTKKASVGISEEIRKVVGPHVMIQGYTVKSITSTHRFSNKDNLYGSISVFAPEQDPKSVRVPKLHKVEDPFNVISSTVTPVETVVDDTSGAEKKLWNHPIKSRAGFASSGWDLGFLDCTLSKPLVRDKTSSLAEKMGQQLRSHIAGYELEVTISRVDDVISYQWTLLPGIIDVTVDQEREVATERIDILSVDESKSDLNILKKSLFFSPSKLQQGTIDQSEMTSRGDLMGISPGVSSVKVPLACDASLEECSFAYHWLTRPRCGVLFSPGDLLFKKDYSLQYKGVLPAGDNTRATAVTVSRGNGEDQHLDHHVFARNYIYEVGRRDLPTREQVNKLVGDLFSTESELTTRSRALVGVELKYQ